jgi:DNA polymerase-1
MIYYLTKHADVYSNFSSIRDLQSIKELLKNETEICLDCETTGLNPLVDKIIMFQLGTKDDKQFIIDARDFNIEELKDLLENVNITYIGHNIKFDYNMLKQHNIILRNVYDTMLVDQVIYNDKYPIEVVRKTHRFSLAGVNKHYFNEGMNKTIRDEFLLVKDRPFTYAQIIYGAEDVRVPFRIKEKQEASINLYNLHKVCSIENKVTLALADIEYNGIELDAIKWMEVVKKYEIRAKLSEKKLDSILISTEKGRNYKKLGLQLDIFGGIDEKMSCINWNSDQQVIEVLNNVFDIYPKDKYGKDSSGKVAIELLDNRNEIVDTLLKYREEIKVVTSFGAKFIKENLHLDNRIRTSFNQIVGTGRISSRNPNMQNIKGNKDEDPDSILFREAFCTNNTDKVLINADFSAQESYGNKMHDYTYDIVVLLY